MATSIPNDPKKLKALLDKLKVMAARGEKNERIVAQRKLEEILAKYGMLGTNPKSKQKVFKVKDWQDHKNLLLQCIIDTKPDAKMEGDMTGRRIVVDLSPIEYILVSEKLRFYWRQLCVNKEALFAAFVVTNKIGIIGNEINNVDEPIDTDLIARFVKTIEPNQFVNIMQKKITN